MSFSSGAGFVWGEAAWRIGRRGMGERLREVGELERSNRVRGVEGMIRGEERARARRSRLDIGRRVGAERAWVRRAGAGRESSGRATSSEGKGRAASIATVPIGREGEPREGKPPAPTSPCSPLVEWSPSCAARTTPPSALLSLAAASSTTRCSPASTPASPPVLRAPKSPNSVPFISKLYPINRGDSGAEGVVVES